MIKKITRINWVQELIATVLYTIISITKIMSNWRVINPDEIKIILENKKPLIIITWHNQIVGINYCWKFKKKVINIVSDHPDSILSSKIQKKFGINSLIRYKNKPTFIYRELLKASKNNDCIFMAADAPHGPVYEVNHDIHSLAKRLGADVVCLSFKTNKKITINSWDKLKIPLPFSKGFYYWGKILKINNVSSEDFHKQLILNLNEGSKIIDENFIL